MSCSDLYWALYSWTTFPLEGFFSGFGTGFVFVASVLDGYKMKPSSFSNLCTPIFYSESKARTVYWGTFRSGMFGK